jgi:tetratricopeptide (TPR) repeat protein
VEPPPGAKAAAYILSKVNSGVSAVENQDYEGAIKDLNEALRFQPGNTKALLYRGRAYFETKNYDQAISDFSTVIKAEENNAAAHSWRGTSYFRKAAPKQDMKLFDLALADHNRAIDLDQTSPNNYASYLAIGTIHRIKKNYEKAVAACNQAIKLQVKNGEGYTQRGDVYFMQSEYDRAIEDYSTAIKLGARGEGEFRLRGVCYHFKRQWDSAIADYTTAITITPENAVLYRFRGECYNEKCDYARALRDLNRSIEVDPHDAEALVSRGDVQLALKAYDEAIADTTQALRIDWKNLRGLVTRGNAYRRVRAYERALANYEAAIKINPEYPWGYDACAYLWATCPEAKYRDGKKALEYATKASRLLKGGPDDAFESLAAACAENGRFDEAVQWQKKAIKRRQENDPLLGEARQVLNLFKQKKPYRE